ncbi:MAG: hypothetical protein ABI459_07725 [Deltaproteobacteria bacterium]
MTPGYIDTFGVPALAELTCVEVFNIAFDTPDGERHVRGIADLSADWAFQPTTVAAVEAAARQATETLPGLGGYKISDVTILLLGDQFAPEGLNKVQNHPVVAQAWDPADPPEGECKMTLFLWGAGGVVADFPATVAHEMFHCVQYATLSKDLMRTAEGGGLWWIEGSAELFAAEAVSEGSALFAVDFSDRVRAQVALYKLSYEAVAFFFWLDQTRGLDKLIPFLARMATSGDGQAQRDAMRGALDGSQWLQFAEAYSDGSILRPHGGFVFGEAENLAQPFVTASTRLNFRFDPFTIFPGRVDFDCGKWQNSGTPDSAELASRMDADLDWTTGWKDDIDTRDGQPNSLRFVAMNTSDVGVDAHLRVRRLAACQPCQGATKLDRCLIGAWEGDTRVIVDLMRRAGAPISRNAMGPMYLLVNEDGTYVTSTVPIDFQTLTVDEHGVTTTDVRGAAGAGGGRWAIVSPGRLAGCSDVVDSTGAVANTQGPNVSASTALFGAGSGGDEGVVSYSCGASSMSTRVVMGRFGEVEFPFTRLSPPEEDAE